MASSVDRMPFPAALMPYSVAPMPYPVAPMPYPVAPMPYPVDLMLYPGGLSDHQEALFESTNHQTTLEPDPPVRVG